MKKIALLAALLLLAPPKSQAEIKEFVATDVGQIVGTWEGSAAYSATRDRSSGTDTRVTVTIKADGTWRGSGSSGNATTGTFTLKDGKVRFQVLSPQPAGWSTVGTWMFYENDGKLVLKSTRDDNNVTGEYTKK